MRHNIKTNRLGLRAGHRKALIRNILTSFLRYEKLKTTTAKAKEVRKTAEKMITRAKQDNLHNRRIVSRKLYDRAVLAKLFTDIGPRFADRPGGYTRIVRLGNRRRGDSAELVQLELVVMKEKKKKERKPKEQTAAKS